MTKRRRRSTGKEKLPQAVAEAAPATGEDLTAARAQVRRFLIFVAGSLVMALAFQYVVGRFIFGMVRWDVMLVTVAGFALSFGLLIGMFHIAKRRAGF